jgi:hypothetical protein
MAPLWLDQRCSCGLAEIPVSEAVCAAPEANALTTIAASVTRAMRAKYCTYASGDHENVNLTVCVATEFGSTQNRRPDQQQCNGAGTDPETARGLMQGDTIARLILTDEPYNVKIAGNVTGARHREFAMSSGEMTDAEFLAFNGAWTASVLPHLRDGGILGTFIDSRGLPTVHSAGLNSAWLL